MSCTQCLFAILLYFLVFRAMADESECSKSEMKDNVRDYINELNKIIEITTKKIRTQKQAYIRQLNLNITKAFDSANCSGVWDKIFPLDQEKEYDLWLWQLFKEHGRLGRKPSEGSVSVGRSIEHFIWLVGKDHAFASCIMTQLRNHVLQWIASDCTEDLQYNTEGLADFHIPSYGLNPDFARDLRSYTNMYAYAYIQSRTCGSLENAQKVVVTINEWVEKDFCFAAADTFVSDSCFAEYNEACPKVVGCFQELTDNFGKYRKVIFGDERYMLKKINECSEASKRFWGESKPEGIPSLGKLIKEGIKLLDAVRSAKLELFDDIKTADSQSFIKAIVKSHFRVEACDCTDESDTTWS